MLTYKSLYPLIVPRDDDLGTTYCEGPRNGRFSAKFRDILQLFSHYIAANSAWRHFTSKTVGILQTNLGMKSSHHFQEIEHRELIAFIESNTKFSDRDLTLPWEG